MPPSETTLILFGHGARDPEWARPMERLGEAVRARTAHDVRLAYLEFMTPTLAECIDAAVGGGAQHIVVIPVFLAQGGHVRRDVPRILADAQARHPAVSFQLRPALGEAQIVIDAMADYVVGAAS
jgi:sirohydrochlorin cobaltochelatase